MSTQTNESGKGLLNYALENPKLTNAAIAVTGAFFLALYALLGSVEAPINLMGLLTASPGLVKGVAVFFKEVGLAAMVAVLINFSIEAFNRKRHDQEKTDLINAIDLAHASQRAEHIKAINQQIFQTVYERNIPNQVFKEIEEQLLRSNFLRLDSTYRLIIEPLDSQYVKINIRHTYQIKNVASTQVIYPMRIGFDVIKAMDSHYKLNELAIGTTRATEIQLKPTPQAKSERHDWWEVKLEQSIPPGGSIECAVEYDRVSPIIGKEAICTLLPTDKMRVRVVDRSGHFSIRAMSLHPRPEIDRSPNKETGYYEWELDGALFPGQGFLVDWMPKHVAEKLDSQQACSTKSDRQDRSKCETSNCDALHAPDASKGPTPPAPLPPNGVS